jgi:rod shape-determining protein MreD
MINNITTNSVRFFVLIVVQVFFLTNLSTYNITVPFLYILFILKLPIGTPRFLLFSLAFLLGLSVDIFYNSLGLNAGACVAMATARILLLSFFNQEKTEDANITPSIKSFGFQKFMLYSIPLVLIHNLYLYNLEYFKWSEVPEASIQALICTCYTLALILMTQYLFGNPKQHKQ